MAVQPNSRSSQLAARRVADARVGAPWLAPACAAPCQKACPVHNDIPGALWLLDPRSGETAHRRVQLRLPDSLVLRAGEVRRDLPEYVREEALRAGVVLRNARMAKAPVAYSSAPADANARPTP